MKIFTFILFFLGSLTWRAYSEECTKKSDLSGTISDYINSNEFERCWILTAPKNYHVVINFSNLEFEGNDRNGVEIIEIKTGRKYTFQRGDKIKTMMFQSDVKIVHYARNKLLSSHVWWSKFTLVFQMSVLPSEIGESLESAVSWLKKRRSLSWGWQEDTPRAIVALYLASAVNFNGTNLEEELMAKQMKLRTSAALVRSMQLTNNELSMLINALLVTCHNPHNVFGVNLVRRLKEQVEATRGFIHPVAYLALCNANETWPAKALDDLRSVLSSASNYPFVSDFQAIAILALTCIKNNSITLNDGSQTSALYNATIARFKSFKNEDGSFGNTHTTALIAQALIASDNDDKYVKLYMKYNDTIEYLTRELNSSDVDFLTIYLTLPILSGNTLVDISKINCSGNPKTHEDDIELDIKSNLNSTIKVQYSLYHGNKDLIYSITLWVPKNFTAYQVMKLAQTDYPKYRFEEKIIGGKIYIYKIAGLINDPEIGTFWLQYVSSSNSVSDLVHVIKSPDELIMKDGQHLVMWYKTAHI